MGLLSILRKKRSSPKKEMHLLMLGLDNAGKTTLLQTLTSAAITRVAQTYGFNLKSLECEGLKFYIWDIGGQPQLRQYWQNFAEMTDVLVYVIDSADVARLEESGQALEELLKLESLANVPLLVYANQQDLGHSLRACEVAEFLALYRIKDRTWQIQECSALKGDGVKEGMKWVCNYVKKKQDSKK